MCEAENYVMVEGILFRLHVGSKDGQECKVTLAVPESMAARMISLYHDSLLACHQGITRTYITLRQKFYIPGLYDKIYAYTELSNVSAEKGG